MPMPDNDTSEPRGFALVIGGGGAVAAASSCGALLALSEIAGVRPSDARVMIGTSAGAALAADLRLGRSLEDIVADMRSRESAAFDIRRAWNNKPELVRRVVGATWVMGQAMTPGIWRISPLRLVQKAFPGSLMAIEPEHWEARYPAEWPKDDLWLVASDLDTGRRAVLTANGYRGAPVALTTAVRASCAVPGVYAPIRVGKYRLVDGGVTSPTNVDLALYAGCRAVIALAPMGYDPRERPGCVRTISRLHLNTTIDRDVAKVRRSGMTILTVRPGADELRHHRMNVLSKQGHEEIIEAAYEATRRHLSAGVGRDVLEQIAAESPAIAG